MLQTDLSTQTGSLGRCCVEGQLPPFEVRPSSRPTRLAERYQLQSTLARQAIRHPRATTSPANKTRGHTIYPLFLASLLCLQPKLVPHHDSRRSRHYKRTLCLDLRTSNVLLHRRIHGADFISIFRSECYDRSIWDWVPGTISYRFGLDKNALWCALAFDSQIAGIRGDLLNNSTR